jgi:hypothetical protein
MLLQPDFTAAPEYAGMADLSESTPTVWLMSIADTRRFPQMSAKIPSTAAFMDIDVFQ